MHRVVVVGAIGSGKTTLGTRLAAALGVPYTDIDAIDLLPGWRHRTRDEFQTLLRAAAEQDSWVMGGDFANSAGRVVWPQADTIVWIDLPWPVTLGRTIRRTVRQIRTHDEVYPGSVQTVRSALSSGLLGFAIKHPGKKRRTHPPLLAPHEERGAVVLRLRSRAAVEHWIAGIEAVASNS